MAENQAGPRLVKPRLIEPRLIETGYSAEEALAGLQADFSEIAGKLAGRPAGSSPSGFVMLELVRHPDRQGEGEFPHLFLAAMNLRPAGQTSRVVRPRRFFGPGGPPGTSYSVCLAVLAHKRDVAAIPAKIKALDPSSPVVREMTCLESASIMAPASRLFFEPGDQAFIGRAEQFEAVLLPLPNNKGRYPIIAFTKLAVKHGFKIVQSKRSGAGHLHILIWGPGEKLMDLAEFSLVWSLKRPGEKLWKRFLSRSSQALRAGLPETKAPARKGE